MERVVVFGCGETADTYFDKIHKRFDVLAFVDNNSDLWQGDKKKNGLKIIAPTQIPNDASVLIASESFYPEMVYQIEKATNRKQIYVLLQGEFLKYSPENRWTDQLEFEYPYREIIPQILQLGLSSRCNSKCQYCIYHSEYSTYDSHQGFMTEDILIEIIKQIRYVDSFKNLLLIGDGETFLHPQWFDFVRRVLKVKTSVKEATIYTNGMLLTQENICKLQRIPVEKLNIVISIDGISPEDCEYWRKGERFPIIQENVHNAFRALGKNVNFIIGGCIVLPHSIDTDSAMDVESFLKHSNDWLKCEFAFANCVVGPALAFVDSIPATKVVEASVFPKICSCRNPFNHISIFANGDILSCPCGYLFKQEDQFRIGNVKKDNLMAVFYDSSIFNRLREDLLKGKKPELCGRCNQLGGSKIRCLQRIESEET